VNRFIQNAGFYLLFRLLNLRYSAILTFSEAMRLKDLSPGCASVYLPSGCGLETCVRNSRFVHALRTITTAMVFLLGTNAHAQEQAAKATPASNPSLTHEINSNQVPRLASGPKLADFEGMEPASDIAKKMLKVTGFIQRDPKDGAPVSQKTEAYLGYTDKSLYIIFLAFDNNVKLLRARMLRRELIDDDDQCGFFLDTFHDHRHAYYFYANPYGIEQDGLYSEANGPDQSFDTVWHTFSKITSQGYIVGFEIPFKSLRFKPSPTHSFGILLARVIPRSGERAYYPENSSRSQGLLVHEGDIGGFEQISPGRNMQFIPYTSLGAFRSLDGRDPAGERFTGKHLEPKAGLDAKIVIKDSLVLDATINPDFGQIESDDPQVTVNQRFEVFFPEKRPFFQENSSYFATPMNLVFTRRVVDPLYGARLTGKVGDWAIGTFVANDRAPGRNVIDTDPLSGNSAYYGVFRVNREIGKNNSIGFIYTDREMHTAPNSFCTITECAVGFNRVGGFDAQFKLNKNWQVNAQAVTSETKLNDGTHLAGPAYQLFGEYSSRKIEFNSTYQDISPGFTTETGFVPRADIRQVNNFFGYTFHSEGKFLVSHGPRLNANGIWDHNGTRLNYLGNANYTVELPRQTFVAVFALLEHERLRPADFSTLPGNRDYAHVVWGPAINTTYFKSVGLSGEIDMGTATNFVPRNGPPVLANFTSVNFNARVRPTKGLTIDNTYLLTRLLDQQTGLNIFNNHIMRSKWNYQFTKEFSLRLIGEYDSTLPNPGLTTLPNSKRFNGDVLFTYLINPGTAIYAGYNSNLQNLDPSLQRVCDGFTCPPGQSPDGLLRTRNTFINDGRQIFVKISYLFRY
jgi:hypothetical protein